MQLQRNIIKQLRDDRAWTQQHLADACGISLRTIQRVEKYGNASHDTALGLASVLEVELEELKVIPDKNKAIFEKVDLRLQFLMIGLALFSGTIIGAIMMYSWIN